MRAFPFWFLRITNGRCGKDSMLNEAHMSTHRRGIVLRVLTARMRPDGCGGRAEPFTRVDLVPSWPVRRIVLRSE